MLSRTQIMSTWKRTLKRTRTKCNRVTYAPPQTQDGLGREETKLSFSTPENCVKSLHHNRMQKIKRYG